MAAAAMPVLEGWRRTKPGHHAVGRPIPRGCATGAAALAWRQHANFRTEHSAGLMWARLHPPPTLGHPFAQVASEKSKPRGCATGAAALAWRKHANFRTEHSAGLMWARRHPLPTLGHPFAQVASENSKAPLCQSQETKQSIRFNNLRCKDLHLRQTCKQLGRERSN